MRERDKKGVMGGGRKRLINPTARGGEITVALDVIHHRQAGAPNDQKLLQTTYSSVPQHIDPLLPPFSLRLRGFGRALHGVERLAERDVGEVDNFGSFEKFPGEEGDEDEGDVAVAGVSCWVRMEGRGGWDAQVGGDEAAARPVASREDGEAGGEEDDDAEEEGDGGGVD